MQRAKRHILVKKIKNLPKEILSSKFFLVSSSIAPGFYNWGDDASVVIAQLINPKVNIIPYQYAFNIFKKSNFLCVGSIITWLTNPNSIIWGSGILYPSEEIKYKGNVVKPKKVLAVRGPLTRKILLERGIECPEIYGDPALLFPKYYQPKVLRKYKCGIIPHFKDKKSRSLEKFRNSKDFHIIDIQDFSDWRKFIDEINSCEFIVSSSLHGIIISDAYGIPNTWVEFDRKDLKRFTFLDYFASVKKDISEPFDIEKISEINDIIKLKSKWKAPEIDLDKLLSVCPFLDK